MHINVGCFISMHVFMYIFMLTYNIIYLVCKNINPQIQTLCSGKFWYPSFLHWATFIPWKIITIKYASRRRIRSTLMDDTSSITGSGGKLKEYDIREGCIITTAFTIFSLFSNMRKYAVSSGLLLNTYIVKKSKV